MNVKSIRRSIHSAARQTQARKAVGECEVFFFYFYFLYFPVYLLLQIVLGKVHSEIYQADGHSIQLGATGSLVFGPLYTGWRWKLRAIILRPYTNPDTEKCPTFRDDEWEFFFYQFRSLIDDNSNNIYSVFVYKFLVETVISHTVYYGPEVGIPLGPRTICYYFSCYYFSCCIEKCVS